MTNITELAQSLKRRATSASEFGESLYVKADDVLALVEALEKAQQRIEELESDLSEWTDCKHDGATYYDMSGQERCGKCGADV
ncbi:Uncharacterised protein [Klebsiella variicola]|uniref:hypothetical protein n=1 Tax=Klebsiella pneumoniae complex TaxID=3390273 RepID=UPI0009D11D4E|nr:MULTISPECIES: hypothetical protein [Klebsiella]HCI6643803.1 hypothetical protein [Klebsiella variicola subsp. variicola]EKT9139058.1 hypothetical protein [Klebsiella variicola]MBZ1709973.1 hypothetical protein [Klebsiella pneumoniae]SLP14435.1 Uncharacterised protein [Klebsiella variicola]HCB9287003.1 hypothetical protein [Klebsiella variicola]